MPTYTKDPLTDCTYIDSGSPTTNYGTVTTMFVGWGSGKGSDIRHIFIEDTGMAVIPAGARIRTESKIELYVAAIVGSANAYFYRPVFDFAELSITWDTAPFYDTPVPTFTGPTAAGWITLTGADFASVVQKMIDDRVNHASVFRMALTASQIQGYISLQINSDDNASNKPKMTIYYELPRSHGYVIG